MVPVGNVALLEYGIEFLASNDVEDIYILCSHNPDEVNKGAYFSRRNVIFSVRQNAKNVCVKNIKISKHFGCFWYFVTISTPLPSTLSIASLRRRELFVVGFLKAFFVFCFLKIYLLNLFSHFFETRSWDSSKSLRR